MYLCFFFYLGYRDSRRRERLEDGDIDSIFLEFFGFECFSYDDFLFFYIFLKFLD